MVVVERRTYTAVRTSNRDGRRSGALHGGGCCCRCCIDERSIAAAAIPVIMRPRHCARSTRRSQQSQRIPLTCCCISIGTRTSIRIINISIISIGSSTIDNTEMTTNRPPHARARAWPTRCRSLGASTSGDLSKMSYLVGNLLGRFVSYLTAPRNPP